MRVRTVLVAGLIAACGAAHAVSTEEDEPSLDPDVAAGKQAIEAKQWPAAIKALSTAALRDTRNADIQNWLGYAYRNAGQLPKAFDHYERALSLNPRHRGAHEYVGEAWLLAGRPDEAEKHLKALQSICLVPCEELAELKERIDRYRQQHGSK